MHRRARIGRGQASRHKIQAGGGDPGGRRGRGRDRDQEKSEEAESGVVTNPETTPILVRMKLSAYDFGKNRAQVEAAAASSKKEGK